MKAQGILKKIFTPRVCAIALALLPWAARAELPPEAYKQMQDIAPEVVTIKIIAAKAQAAVVTGDSTGPGAMVVAANATVTSVTRTATSLKPGDILTLYYAYLPLAPGAVGLDPPPIVKSGSQYIAYLTGGPSPKPYAPAARAQSFVDPAQAAKINTAMAGKPVADPTLLPTPDQPSPHGVVKFIDNVLDSFATVKETDGHWNVTLGSFKSPLPLQIDGDTPPIMLVYYLPPARAPLTQPSVLLYEGGKAPVIIRALIIDSEGRVLGDAPWAGDPAKKESAPIWQWTEYKLEVIDSVAHTTQEIPLSAAADLK